MNGRLLKSKLTYCHIYIIYAILKNMKIIIKLITITIKFIFNLLLDIIKRIIVKLIVLLILFSLFVWFFPDIYNNMRYILF